MKVKDQIYLRTIVPLVQLPQIWDKREKEEATTTAKPEKFPNIT